MICNRKKKGVTNSERCGFDSAAIEKKKKKCARNNEEKERKASFYINLWERVKMVAEALFRGGALNF